MARSFTVVLLFSIAFASGPRSSGPVCAQGQAPESTPPTLRLLFSDDFGQDTRATYRLKGDVAWRQNTLVLSQESAVQRAITGGFRVQVDVIVEPAPELAKAAHWMLGLDLGKGERCRVRVRRMGEDTDVAVAHITEKATEKVLRSTRHAGPLSELTVEFRHGLVVLNSGETELLRAFVPRDLQAVEAIELQSVESTVVCRSLTVRSIAPRGKLDQAGRDQVQAARKLEPDLMAAYRAGKYQNAAQVARRIVKHLEAAHGRFDAEVGTWVGNAAFMLQKAGKHKEALAAYEQTLEISLATLGPQHPEHANTLNNLAGVYDDIDELDRSLELYTEVQKTWETTYGRPHPRLALLDNNLGELYRSRGEYRRALEVLERSSNEHLALTGESKTYATVLNNLAGLCRKLGDHDRALQLLTKAKEIRASVIGRRHPSYAFTLHELGGIYEDQGDYVAAERAKREAIGILASTLTKRNHYYASAISSLGKLHLRLGDYATATELFAEARNTHRQLYGEKHSLYLVSASNLAAAYGAAGNTRKQLELFGDVLAARKELFGKGSVPYANSLMNTGRVYVAQGQVDVGGPMISEAIAVYEKVLGSDHIDTARGLVNHADALRRQGLSDAAHQALSRAIGIHESALGKQNVVYINLLNGLALLEFDAGKKSVATERLTQGTELAREIIDRTALLQSARQQHAMQSSLRGYLDNRISAAVGTAAANEELIEHVWRWKGGVTRRQLVYRKLAANPEIAPLYDELRASVQELSANLQTPPVSLESRSGDPNEAAARGKVEAWQRRMRDLQREKELIESQIAERSTEFRQLQSPLRVSDVAGRLDAKTAVVDLVAYNHRTAREDQRADQYEARYLVCIVRADRDPVVMSLQDAASLGAATDQFRAELAKSDRRASSVAGAAIRRRLWSPIEEHLDGIETVIVSPDSLLGTLPWAALPGSKPGTLLIEDYRLASIPFVNLFDSLLHERSQPSTGDRLLVLGDVDYEVASAASTKDASSGESDQAAEKKWKPLPGFRDELASVRSLHQTAFGREASVTTLVRDAATETEFLSQAAQSGTLHLITHGFFAGRNTQSVAQAEAGVPVIGQTRPTKDPFVGKLLPGQLSGLVMAGANRPVTAGEQQDDGILRAAEIEASSLQGVNLVVLSACETGLGAVAGGEGLTGLQRAFHVAGARSVIASLWKVDDRATQELMRRFYTNLWIRKMSKLDALRQAQLWMLRHPQELAAMGVNDAMTRGKPRERKPDDAGQRKAKDRTDPFFWAAFQLSGDWK